MSPSLGCSTSHPHRCRYPQARTRQVSESRAPHQRESDDARAVPGPHNCGPHRDLSAVGHNARH